MNGSASTDRICDHSHSRLHYQYFVPNIGTLIPIIGTLIPIIGALSRCRCGRAAAQHHDCHNGDITSQNQSGFGPVPLEASTVTAWRTATPSRGGWPHGALIPISGALIPISGTLIPIMAHRDAIMRRMAARPKKEEIEPMNRFPARSLHLRRDWGSPRHICAATGAHACHICAATGARPCHICTGTGLTPMRSAATPTSRQRDAVTAHTPMLHDGRLRKRDATRAHMRTQSRRRCGQGRAQSRRRCGQGRAQSRRRCGNGKQAHPPT